MLSSKLKEYRANNNMTQEDLANKLCVSRSAVAKWEQGKGIPSKQSLIDLENLMGVSQEELLQEDEYYQVIENINDSYRLENKIKKIILLVLVILLLILLVFLIKYIIKANKHPEIKYCSELEVVKVYFGNDDHNPTVSDLNENNCCYEDETQYMFIKLRHNNEPKKIYIESIKILNVERNEIKDYSLEYSGLIDDYYILKVELDYNPIGTTTFRLIELSCVYDVHEIKKLSYNDVTLTVKLRNTYVIQYKIFDYIIKTITYYEGDSVYISQFIDEELKEKALLIIYQFCEKYEIDLKKNKWLENLKWENEKKLICNQDFIVNATFGYNNNDFNIDNLGINYNISVSAPSINFYNYLPKKNQVGLTRFSLYAYLNDERFSIYIKSNDEYNEYYTAEKTGELELDIALQFELIGIAHRFKIYTTYKVEVVPYKVVGIAYRSFAKGRARYTYAPIDEKTNMPIVNETTINDFLYDEMELQEYKDYFKTDVGEDLNITSFDFIDDIYYITFDSNYKITHTDIISSNYNESDDVYYLKVGEYLDLKILINGELDPYDLNRCNIRFISNNEEVISMIYGVKKGTAEVTIDLAHPYYLFNKTIKVIVYE